METTDIQPDVERGDDREQESVRSNEVGATERAHSDTRRVTLSTVEYDITQTPQRRPANPSIDDTGGQSVSVFNELGSLAPSPHDSQTVPVRDQYRERDASEPMNEPGARQPQRVTEANSKSASPDVPVAAEPPPTPTHQYTLGRERPETPTQSSGSPAGQREVTPPRLHIGEVVIRVEEDPKPQRAKRRGRTSTLSDSQRLIRSL